MQIDMEQTGLRLKQAVANAGYDVKTLQRCLHLSCPQPIYRWFKGKLLPSVDHLLLLSRLLDVHMEDLLVIQPVAFGRRSEQRKRRCRMYCHCLGKGFGLSVQ